MKVMSIVSALLGLFSCSDAYTDLDSDAFQQIVQEGAIALVDVRTSEEYAAGHIPEASNCDWYSEDFMSMVEAAYPKETPLAIYCRSGKRSAAAATKLSKAGYTVYNLKGGYLAWTEAGKPVTKYEAETFFTESGVPVRITLVKHGSLAISYKGKQIQVDPVCGLGKPTDYAVEFPKADVILITHEHGDHLDKDAVAALTEDGKTTLVTNSNCADILGWGTVMANGDSMSILGDIVLDAVPAYNYTDGHARFHPKGRDNGFVLTVDGLRIYIAGDTEDIPEMSKLKDIDVAFLPVNQPYTMTVGQCVNAARAISPKVLIPYHFSQTDISGLPALLPEMKVLLRQMQ